MNNVWFITGSSRGLGRSLTEAVLAAGHRVVATARQPEQLADLQQQYGEQLLPLALDVNDHAQIQAAVDAALARFGRLDVVVNNAGFGVVGAAEAFSEEQVRSQLDTNLYAPIAVTRAVLPVLRRQGSGRILQISSVGGRVGNAGLTMYQAAKFGLAGFSEALAKEVAPLGIFVTSVEPGGFRTDWAGASMSYTPAVAGYDTTVTQRADYMRSGQYVPVGDPAKAAQALLALSQHPAPPVHLLLGSEAVALLRQADAARQAELEQWLPVSLSTDADDADSQQFMRTGLGSMFSSESAADQR
ncbi:SDR family NAD(P)-dependent oxidoreductase [Hymenobacter sp. 15J16-1T3B]|uniref:oxidoreductase n=1 Tax=Hymenobacter sp. 15J16-1T3B TaxID=2886941 RepID=UPI001D120B0D|nr:oxidoreductase [Hymenobacter sp. 15J16-1T3B]MCC3156761.1 SDR family NAD(P)-dependent oxidoreductase [Hymenobacter sp. 15J16-1T3B]